MSAEYIVRRGDSMYSIARRLSVSPMAFMNANPDLAKRRPPYGINPGDKLVVPTTLPTPAAKSEKPSDVAKCASKVCHEDYLKALGEQLDEYSDQLVRAAPSGTDLTKLRTILDDQKKRIIDRQREGRSTVGMAGSNGFFGEGGRLGRHYVANYQAQHGSALHDMQSAYAEAIWPGGNFESANIETAETLGLNSFGTQGATAAAGVWQSIPRRGPIVNLPGRHFTGFGPGYDVPSPPAYHVPYPDSAQWPR